LVSSKIGFKEFRKKFFGVQKKMSNYNAQRMVENYLGNYTDQQIGEWVRNNAPAAIGMRAAEQRRHAANILSNAGYTVGAQGLQKRGGGALSPRANFGTRSPRSSGYAARTNYASRSGSTSPRGYASRSGSTSPRGYAARTNYASRSGSGYSSNLGARSPRRRNVAEEPTGPEDCPMGTTFVHSTTVSPTMTAYGPRAGSERAAYCRNLPVGNEWSQEVGQYARDNNIPANVAAHELSLQRQGNY